MRQRTRWSVALALIAASSSAEIGNAELVAERIDATNAARTIRAGHDAAGGLGDWALQNGTVCAVVADPSHESDLATTGGGLLDLGLCGRDDDQFMLYLELINGTLDQPVRVEAVVPELQDGTATLVARGGGEGLAVETRYTSTKWPRWFWQPLERFVCHLFHRFLLRTMRRKAELGSGG